MKAVLSFILCALVVFSSYGRMGAQEQQELTNSSIIQMVKSGLSGTVIIDAIRSQPHKFSLSAADLIALKQAGVSEDILEAMLTSNPPSFPIQERSLISQSTKLKAKTLSEVRTILIWGNNEAASNARNDLLTLNSKYPSASCFRLVGDRKAADAVLDINEADTAGGSGGMFGGTNLETTVASGTLTNSDEDLLWSSSKQGIQGVVHTGAGSAASFLLLQLFVDSGCTKSGLRRGISAPAAAAAAAAPANYNLKWVRNILITNNKGKVITKVDHKNLKDYSCLQPVTDVSHADVVVVLGPSLGWIPRGAFRSSYQRATVISKNHKTVLWTYDEADIFLPGQGARNGEWWQQLNKVVGCGATGKNKTWPPKTASSQN